VVAEEPPHLAGLEDLAGVARGVSGVLDGGAAGQPQRAEHRRRRDAGHSEQAKAPLRRQRDHRDDGERGPGLVGDSQAQQQAGEQRPP
jgi:hypothetical protein